MYNACTIELSLSYKKVQAPRQMSASPHWLSMMYTEDNYCGGDLLYCTAGSIQKNLSSVGNIPNYNKCYSYTSFFIALKEWSSK
jgi:hypothetical protein